jgi:hypothetical protein
MSAFMSRRSVVRLVAAAGMAPAAVAASTLALGSSAETFTGIIPGVGAGGHDVVAYFNAGRPVVGSPAIVHAWGGAVWRFANAANRDAFAASPDRYAPAYGGHCAWAAAQGYKAKGDPRHWAIVDGRLFLNYNASVHRTWRADIPRLVVDADRQWGELRHK